LQVNQVETNLLGVQFEHELVDGVSEEVWQAGAFVKLIAGLKMQFYFQGVFEGTVDEELFLTLGFVLENEADEVLDVVQELVVLGREEALVFVGADDDGLDFV